MTMLQDKCDAQQIVFKIDNYQYDILGVSFQTTTRHNGLISRMPKVFEVEIEVTYLGLNTSPLKGALFLSCLAFFLDFDLGLTSSNLSESRSSTPASGSETLAFALGPPEDQMGSPLDTT